MPKDWTSHKAELERLYITEKNTLEEVREIMKGQGFHASIRAYRMRFGQWGLRKYKVIKVKKPRAARGVHHHSSVLDDIETDEASDSSSVSQAGTMAPATFTMQGLVIPTKPLTARQLEDCIPVDHNATLEIVLVKWRPGRLDYLDYLERLLIQPVHCSMILADSPGGHLGGDLRARSMFEIIRILYCFPEDRNLIQLLLRADLARCDTVVTTNPWSKNWRTAFAAPTWQEARNALSYKSEVLMEQGSIFFNTALRVLAESRLAKLVGSISLDLSVEDRKEYLSILKDFDYDSHFGVEKKWYQLFIQSEARNTPVTSPLPHVTVENAHAQIVGPVAVKLEKYRRLLSVYTRLSPEAIDDQLDSLLKKLLDQLPACAVRNLGKQVSGEAVARVHAIFEVILDRWRRGDSINTQVSFLTKYFGYGVLLYSPNGLPDWTHWMSNNLSSDEQISLVKTILHSFGEAPIELPEAMIFPSDYLLHLPIVPTLNLHTIQDLQKGHSNI